MRLARVVITGAGQEGEKCVQHAQSESACAAEVSPGAEIGGGDGLASHQIANPVVVVVVDAVLVVVDNQKGTW